MRRAERLLQPRGLLARVRWAFLLIALFDASLALVLIGASDAPLPLRIVAVAGCAVLAARWVHGYRAGQFSIYGDLLAGPVLLLIGFGTGDPMRACMLVFPGLFLQALYSGRRKLAFATAIQFTAAVLAILASPHRDTLTPWSPEVVLQPSGVMMVLVMHMLGSTLARHERAAARERALAQVGSALVASCNAEAVFTATLECIRAIASPHGAARTILLAGNVDHMRVVGTDSPNAGRLRGAEFDLEQHPEVRKILSGGAPIDLTGDDFKGTATTLGLPSWTPFAYTLPLFARERLRGALSVMTQTRLANECKDGLRALAMEVALALDNIALRERLEHDAFHDVLTDLPNRSLLMNRTQQALNRVGSDGGSLAMLLLDVDGFKTVNDSLGHAAGDHVLGEVATRLKRCLRDVDTGARLGGDEFAVLLEEPDGNAVDTSRLVAERILEALRAPVVLPTTEVFVTASIGIALAHAGETVEELLSHADVAMYAAKRSGKSRVSVFEPRLRTDIVRRLQMETDLRRALEAGQFRLHYQPIVDLRTRRPVSFEALVRWQHPHLGLVSPDQFVPLAEETGLIVPLGRWVLQEALAQLRRWQLGYPGMSGLTMHVNVAARQLREPGLVADVRQCLRHAEVRPEALVLEVTENALIHRAEGVAARLHQLRALGVHLAMDDFGTGYSSLAYLRDLPFDTVKIDKTFVHGVVEDPQRSALVQAIVGLSRVLELEAIPEGIERPQEAAKMQWLGCRLAQGFYFARPDEAHVVEALLRSEEPLAA